jgi:hypothetical protein
VSPILTSKIDYDRLLEEENFHLDIHLKVQGVKLFKDEDDVDIVLGNTDILYIIYYI